MQLHFTDTILKSIQTVKDNLKFFSALVLLFLLGNLALLGIVLLFNEPSLLLAIALRLIELALYVKLAVTVHRSVILDEVGQWRSVFTWQKADNLFYAISFVLSILAWLAMALFLFIINLIFGDSALGLSEDNSVLWWTVILTLFAGAVFAKICLIFPSSAVDKELAIEESLNLTKGNFFNIFALTVLLPFTTAVLADFIVIENQIWLNIIYAFSFNLVLVFEITILSHIYQKLTHDENYA